MTYRKTVTKFLALLAVFAVTSVHGRDGVVVELQTAERAQQSSWTNHRIAASSATKPSSQAISEIYTIANGIKSFALADNGEIKRAFLDLEDRFRQLWNDRTYCSPRRVGDLSRAYRGVLTAAAHGDAYQIYQAAEFLNYTAHGRSKMYQACWNTMLRHSGNLYRVAQHNGNIVMTGRAAGWSSN